MKRNYFILSTVLLVTFLAASCKKEQDGGVADGPRIFVSVEDLLGEDDGTEAKAIYEITNSTTGAGRFKWKKSDKVRIYDADNGYIHQVFVDEQANAAYNYSTNEVSGSTSFQSFGPSNDPLDNTGNSVSLTETGHYYAFYPSFYVERIDNVFLYTIPQKSVIDNNTNIVKWKEMVFTRYPMACKTTGFHFQLKNLLSGYKIKLTKANVLVKSIQVEAIGDQHISGTFDVTFNSSGIPSLNQRYSSATPTDKSVILEFNQPVNITDGHDFYLPLPGVNYNHGLKITVTNDKNETATFTVGKTSGIVFQRNVIKRSTIPESKLNFEKTHGEFSINNNGDKVYIAPGNLQYFNANWQFATEQYEILHPMNCDGQTTYSPGYEWDLFRYSTINGAAWTDANGVYQDPSTKGSVFGTVTESNVPYESTNIPGCPQFKDWGLAFGPTSRWITPSSDELSHIITGRIRQNQVHCHVGNFTNGVSYVQAVLTDGSKYYPGMIVFPDTWAKGYTDANVSSKIAALTIPGCTSGWNSAWTINSWEDRWVRSGNGVPEMDVRVFKVLEDAGCAFFPGGGYISSSNMQIINYCVNEEHGSAICHYWTRTCFDWGQGLTQANVWSAQNYNPDYIVGYQQINTPVYAAVRLIMPVPNN